MKFIEFHYRIKKIKKIIIHRQNNENYEIHKIPIHNKDNHENLIIQP